eukprot:9504096-Pyramimonas_sp.AAC.2
MGSARGCFASLHVAARPLGVRALVRAAMGLRCAIVAASGRRNGQSAFARPRNVSRCRARGLSAKAFSQRQFFRIGQCRSYVERKYVAGGTNLLDLRASMHVVGTNAYVIFKTILSYFEDFPPGASKGARDI